MSTSSSAVPAKWDASKIISQKGKIAIVTGANAGIGFVTALELARHGAHVVLACRSEQRGLEAVHKIQQELQRSPATAGSVAFQQLDVSSLASVKVFADEFKKTHTHLDLLINNAGVFAVPFALTADGIETQFATNHLGHFALTAYLLDLMKKSHGTARIVNVSSKLHADAKLDVNQIMAATKGVYNELGVYANTKVYSLLFSLELNRRLRASGATNVIAATAHPGFTATNMGSSASTWLLRMSSKIKWVLPFTQTSEFGALPILYAAVGENIEAGDYIGPDGFRAMAGHPTKEQPSNLSKSDEHAKKLWSESERLAKLRFTIQ